MGRQLDVRWEGELSATPRQAWEAITVHTAAWLWEVEYEPRVGGAERGLTGRGTVTEWDPPRRFTTRASDGDWFNQLDYRLEPRNGGTFLRYRHQGVLAEKDYDRELDACRRHTDFYYHTLAEYLRHFGGRKAAYFHVDVPESLSASGGFARLRVALGVPEDVAVGDKVRLTQSGSAPDRLAQAGITPIEGVVDYATEDFLGVRGPDALYRFYGRDAWGWPVGMAQHMFDHDGADARAAEKAWADWLAGVFQTEEEGS